MHTFDPEKALSSEDSRRLVEASVLDDETIDTSDAPELPVEAWKFAIRNPYLRRSHPPAARKAS